MQNKERIQYLLQQHIDKTASLEERKELFEALKDQGDTGEWEEVLQQLAAGSETDPLYDSARWEPVIDSILHHSAGIESKKPAKLRTLVTWSRVAAAAVVILLAGTGSYLWLHPTAKTEVAKVQQPLQVRGDVAPGRNRAVLTLANGSQIVLDSAANGTLTQQGNTKIIKLDSGQLAYQQSGSSPSGEAGMGFNTITTPKGGQYQIVLADGSKVWLNAASSLRYPTSFNGKERNVELTGEGYFEVAHNAAKPFTVAVNGIEVHDIGTAFNINAYDDETTIKTTLLEGSVKVSKGSTSKMIKPGQQAQIENHGNPLTPKITVQAVDVEEAIAWKEGQFNFKSTNITAIMRQVSRWYDVEVEYKGNVSSLDFSGIISRKENVSRLLNVLQATGTVHFKIDNKKIIVTP